MNVLSVLILTMLVQQAERVEQPDSPGVRILSVDELLESGTFRDEFEQPGELESFIHTWQYSGITDRGLMIEGQLYCIRIVIPDSTHSMPLVSGGSTAPMPMWPHDLKAEKSQESEVTIWDMVHKLNQLDEDANR